jgi:nucleotide-binding universal stress UspA family protein
MDRAWVPQRTWKDCIMSELELVKNQTEPKRRSRAGASNPIFRHVLVCLDQSPYAQPVLAHAAAIASAVGARLTVMRVLEAHSNHAPADPIEWKMRHHDVLAELRERASGLGDIQCDTVVLDGQAAECICAWARENRVDLTVIGAAGNSNWPFAGLGGTARRVAEAASGSVLLVPSLAVADKLVWYRRVLTPLDGSSRSECALPVAMAIAAAHDAEVVLVHAAPNVELTEIGPLEAEAITLRDQLRRRNELVAARYLGQVQSHLPRTKVSTRTRVLASGDPRHELARAALDENSDIIVLSSTGLSGHPDLSVGSVAEYLINHAEKPILLVRASDPTQLSAHPGTEGEQPVRLPNRALM